MPMTSGLTGLRQFLSPNQQRDWLDGKSDLPGTTELSESVEQRFKYTTASRNCCVARREDKRWNFSCSAVRSASIPRPLHPANFTTDGSARRTGWTKPFSVAMPGSLVCRVHYTLRVLR